jgi:palmitoyl-protein thioesterase
VTLPRLSHKLFLLSSLLFVGIFCKNSRSPLNINKQSASRNIYSFVLAHQEATYRKVSLFIADINQERTFNEQYKTNLLKIRNLVLVKFLRDTMVYPHESEHFGFYATNDTSKIIPLRESSLYINDLLGLKIMDQQSRIKFLDSDTDHLRFTDQWFIDNIIPFLKD